MGRELFPAL